MFQKRKQRSSLPKYLNEISKKSTQMASGIPSKFKEDFVRKSVISVKATKSNISKRHQKCAEPQVLEDNSEINQQLNDMVQKQEDMFPFYHGMVMA